MTTYVEASKIPDQIVDILNHHEERVDATPNTWGGYDLPIGHGGGKFVRIGVDDNHVHVYLFEGNGLTAQAEFQNTPAGVIVAVVDAYMS